MLYGHAFHDFERAVLYLADFKGRPAIYELFQARDQADVCRAFIGIHAFTKRYPIFLAPRIRRRVNNLPRLKHRHIRAIITHHYAYALGYCVALICPNISQLIPRRVKSDVFQSHNRVVVGRQSYHPFPHILRRAVFVKRFQIRRQKTPHVLGYQMTVWMADVVAPAFIEAIIHVSDVQNVVVAKMGISARRGIHVAYFRKRISDSGCFKLVGQTARKQIRRHTHNAVVVVGLIPRHVPISINLEPRPKIDLPRYAAIPLHKHREMLQIEIK